MSWLNKGQTAEAERFKVGQRFRRCLRIGDVRGMIHLFAHRFDLFFQRRAVLVGKARLALLHDAQGHLEAGEGLAELGELSSSIHGDVVRATFSL